jgi:hypothetical protein
MFFYLTNVVLDISSGVLWWVIKNTTYGAYKGIKYITYDAHQPDIDNIPEKTIIMEEIKQLRQDIAKISPNLNNNDT